MDALRTFLPGRGRGPQPPGGRRHRRSRRRTRARLIRDGAREREADSLERHQPRLSSASSCGRTAGRASRRGSARRGRASTARSLPRGPAARSPPPTGGSRPKKRYGTNPAAAIGTTRSRWRAGRRKRTPAMSPAIVPAGRAASHQPTSLRRAVRDRRCTAPRGPRARPRTSARASRAATAAQEAARPKISRAPWRESRRSPAVAARSRVVVISDPEPDEEERERERRGVDQDRPARPGEDDEPTADRIAGDLSDLAGELHQRTGGDVCLVGDRRAKQCGPCAAGYRREGAEREEQEEQHPDRDPGHRHRCRDDSRAGVTRVDEAAAGAPGRRRSTGRRRRRRTG